jgi:hypothetical protein
MQHSNQFVLNVVHQLLADVHIRLVALCHKAHRTRTPSQ